MAHFAELNNNKEVLRVVVISNDDIDANGGDESTQAETFVSNLIPHQSGGVSWKQTSYNGNFRKQYAGVGYTYDSVKDKFIRPQPYPSWTLNADDDWEAPVAYPTVQNVDENIQLPVKEWSEDDQTWKSTGTDSNNYLWNSATSSWDLA